MYNESTPLITTNDHAEIEGSFKAAVFGFSDGLTTSVTLVLGVALTHQPHDTVVLAGVAGLFSGASSMACGEWLSSRAERDTHAAELEKERWHLQTIPREEADHMKQILTGYGLSESTADAINRDVAALPLERQALFHGKFELGIDMDDQSAWRNAVAMWFSFCLGAFLPLWPWLCTRDAATAIAGSVASTCGGIVCIAAYQVRGRARALPGALGRQLLVTALAVGLTVLFDIIFV